MLALLRMADRPRSITQSRQPPMRLEWRDGRISFIHDYRYVRYVIVDAELACAPDAEPASDGAAR
jgi:hypothetical protein